MSRKQISKANNKKKKKKKWYISTINNWKKSIGRDHGRTIEKKSHSGKYWRCWASWESTKKYKKWGQAYGMPACTIVLEEGRWKKNKESWGGGGTGWAGEGEAPEECNRLQASQWWWCSDNAEGRWAHKQFRTLEQSRCIKNTTPCLKKKETNRTT